MTGDTGAEVGVRFLTLGGRSGELVPASRDTKEFFEGKSSLRIDWDNKRHYGNREYFTDRYFGVNLPELDRNQEYTVSFYAKASVDDFPIGVHLFTREVWRLESSYYKWTTIGRKWKRWSFTFKPKIPSGFVSSAYSLNIMMMRGKKDSKAGTVWFDAFQLEKGKEATDYVSPPVAAELTLKSSGPKHIIGKNDKITAEVKSLLLRDCGPATVELTVTDWENKIRKQYKVPLGKGLTKSFPLPSDRYGWFNVRMAVTSGGTVLNEQTLNYLVVRPRVETAPGMRPFCGSAGPLDWSSEAVAANCAIGSRRLQIFFKSCDRGMWTNEPSKGKFDFTNIDWKFREAEKHGMLVKFNVSPFDWKLWHFPPEEVEQMKKLGISLSMLELPHRKFWNDLVKLVLDRYGDRIDTIEFGAEDNGRLGINPHFKKKYPEGVVKDSLGHSWVAAGPAFDALCILVTDACRMTRKRYPKMRIGAIRPSQGLPGEPWLFVWNMFKKIGREFNTLPLDTYAMVPFEIGPGVDKSKRKVGGPDSRFFTMEHAKKMIAQYGCGQDVFLSETGTQISNYLCNDHSPYRLEEAEFLAQDMLAAKCAGFSAYDTFMSIRDVEFDSSTFSMAGRNGPQMSAAAHSQAAQVVENVTETRWTQLDKVCRVALFKKHDGSGWAAVYAQPGYTMRVPDGVQVVDFMGNDFEPGKDRTLKLSGAPWYFRAAKYETLAKKMEKADIDQTDFCQADFRHITGDTGLIRFINHSNQLPLALDCLIEIDGREYQRKVIIAAGSWNSFRVPVGPKTRKLTIRCRRPGDKKDRIMHLAVPPLSPLGAGPEPATVLGKVESGKDILPFEPWTPWTGVKDLGMVLSGFWTDSELKLKAVVNDDRHHPAADKTRPWTGDSLQIAIDPKNNGSFFLPQSGKLIGDDDREIGFMLGRDKQKHHVVACGGKEIEMNYSIVRDDKAGTTVYELAIPWKELGVEPKPGMVFGLSAVVFDDDTGLGQEYHGLIGGGITHGKNPALYRRFILTGKESK